MTFLSALFCPSHPQDGNARAAPMGGAYRATLDPLARGEDGPDRSYCTALGMTSYFRVTQSSKPVTTFERHALAGCLHSHPVGRFLG